MSSTLIRSKFLITNALGNGSPVLEDGALYQRDGEILAVGQYDELKERFSDAEELGGSNYLLFPGLINAHHHGSGLSLLQQGHTEENLEFMLFRGLARRGLDPYLNTLYTCAKMIESGVTCSLHHAYAAGEAETYLRVMEDALRAHADAGMRAALALAAGDQNNLVYEEDDKFLNRLPPNLRQQTTMLIASRGLPADDYFEIFHQLRDRYRDNGQVRILLGPAGLQWCSDGLLARIADTARSEEVGIHLHAVESPYQKLYPLRRFGQTALAHLRELGVLGPRTSCAHSVWVTEDDLEILADSQTTVVHNPSSNLRLGCGVAPVLAMWQSRINVALGMDGTTLNDDDDILQEIRLCLRLHRPIGLETEHLSPAQAFAMATVNGARAAQFGDQIGQLAVGKRADLVLMKISTQPASAFDKLGVLEAFLYLGKTTSIDTVMIDGQIVMRDGELTTIDKQALIAELSAQAEQEPTTEQREREELVAALEPHMLQFYRDWTLDSGRPFYLVNSRN